MQRILEIWAGGGWVMWPLLGVSLMMFTVGVRLWLDLRRSPHRRMPDALWHEWVRRPESAEGEVGEMIRYVQEAETTTDVSLRCSEVAVAHLPVVDRRLSTLSTLVAAAPLVGLLGTVFGMLVTFQALAAGGGGKVTEAMADGISQALFPPEVGLCIALPGLVLVHLIKRERQELEAFFARLESYLIQHRRRTLPPDEPSAPVAAIEPLRGALPVPQPA